MAHLGIWSRKRSLRPHARPADPWPESPGFLLRAPSCPMMQFLTDCFVLIQGWLFDTLVQPVLFALGLAGYVEMGFEGIEFALLGVIELTIAYALMRPPRSMVACRALDAAPCGAGGCDLFGTQPPGHHPSGGLRAARAGLHGTGRLAALPRHHPAPARGLAPWTRPASACQLLHLPGDTRLCRILAAPPFPHLSLVVGPARHPSLAAPDVVLDRLPQPPARRPDRRLVVCLSIAADWCSTGAFSRSADRAAAG
jgi:hypothetical protein